MAKKDRRSNPQYANSVRNARRKRGVSQINLSKRLGCSSVSLSQIENGNAYPSFKLLNRIADKLNYKLLITVKFTEWESSRKAQKSH